MNRQELDGIAIDLGGTKISATRFHAGEQLKELRAETVGTGGAEQQIGDIIDLVGQLEPGHHERLGVAVAGRIDRDGMWHAVNGDTLNRIDSIPLKGLLEQRLKRAVTVANDAAAAAVGEYLCGAGRGVDNFAYVTVSTGIGGGLILDGRPLRSRHGLAGHVGFTTSRIATDPCGSGRYGTVESVASGRALARLAAESGHEGLTGRQVFEAHLSGEPWAQALVRNSASAVAELCSNLRSLLDIDRVAIGGSVGLAAGYIDLVRDALDLEPALFRPELTAAELGAASAQIGVLCMTP